MKDYELKKYNKAQMDQILTYRYIINKEEKENISINQAASEWINKYGKRFRQNWMANNSYKRTNIPHL